MAKAKVIALYTECCRFLREGEDWTEGSMHSAVPHEHKPVLRLIASRRKSDGGEA